MPAMRQATTPVTRSTRYVYLVASHQIRSIYRWMDFAADKDKDIVPAEVT